MLASGVLQRPARVTAAVMNCGVLAPPQLKAAATEPPDAPATLVVLVMMPRDLRMA